MAKAKDILGINARSSEYLRLNTKRARKFCNDKFLAKSLFAKKKVPHPRLLSVIENMDQLRGFDWVGLNTGFVMKPVQGLGGDGILIIKKPSKYAGEWLRMDGKKLDIADLALHAQDILEGRYSRHNVPDKAMIEERVKIHPKFRKMRLKGTPDVRVIVFNRVPVMAMLRLPTEESKGKANLHQGAIGLGVDLATGITTHGVSKDRRLKYLLGTQKKVNGITVPNWKEVLLSAVRSVVAARLGYAGADVLIDEEKGPLVIELNDQPGLSVQIANMTGLRRRLERVEGLEVESAEKGVSIARALFASKFAKRVKNIPGEKRVVGIFETAKVKVGRKKRVEIKVKIDTGARSTSIDRELAESLGLLTPENVLWEKRFKSALGIQNRQVIKLVYWLRGKRVETRVGVTDRHNLRRKMLIGRRDLTEFVVDPGLVRLRRK